MKISSLKFWLCFCLFFVVDREIVFGINFEAPLTTGIKQKQAKGFDHFNPFTKLKEKI